MAHRLLILTNILLTLEIGVGTLVHRYLREVSVQLMRFCLFSAIVFDGVKQVGFASVKVSISPLARDFR
jgi:hypothetical protein